MDNMIVYVEHPKESTKKIPRTSKWVQQSQRIQDQHPKLIAFLYTNNEQ